jgi:hypothetical protein
MTNHSATILEYASALSATGDMKYIGGLFIGTPGPPEPWREGGREN